MLLDIFEKDHSYVIEFKVNEMNFDKTFKRVAEVMENYEEIEEEFNKIYMIFYLMAPVMRYKEERNEETLVEYITSKVSGSPIRETNPFKEMENYWTKREEPMKSIKRVIKEIELKRRNNKNKKICYMLLPSSGYYDPIKDIFKF